MDDGTTRSDLVQPLRSWQGDVTRPFSYPSSQYDQETHMSGMPSNTYEGENASLADDATISSVGPGGPTPDTATESFAASPGTELAIEEAAARMERAHISSPPTGLRQPGVESENNDQVATPVASTRPPGLDLGAIDERIREEVMARVNTYLGQGLPPTDAARRTIDDAKLASGDAGAAATTQAIADATAAKDTVGLQDVVKEINHLRSGLRLDHCPTYDGATREDAVENWIRDVK